MSDASKNNVKKPLKSNQDSTSKGNAKSSTSKGKQDSNLDLLEAEMGAEIEHGQLSSDELNSENDI